MESLVHIDFPDIPALGKTPVCNMRMVAACDQLSSTSLAAAGLEVNMTISRQFWEFAEQFPDSTPHLSSYTIR